MSLRPVFAILIAFAMLFAPFAMQTGGAMAAMPSGHHGAVMENGHCVGQPDDRMADKGVDKSCCIAMCAAIAIAPVSPAQPLAFTISVGRSAPEQFRHGYFAELATPPPRLA
ncbi:MAG: hypothetical protein H0W74_07690 [Sphingosinicella sp.]|nr:hypothetical protein [Sphingosinicella sp.]